MGEAVQNQGWRYGDPVQHPALVNVDQPTQGLVQALLDVRGRKLVLLIAGSTCTKSVHFRCHGLGQIRALRAEG